MKEINDLNKMTSVLNQKLKELTNKKDSLSKNLSDWEKEQKLLEKQRLDEEKRLKKERETQERLNSSQEVERPKKKKVAKKGDAIDDMVTRFMEDNDLKLPFE